MILTTEWAFCRFPKTASTWMAAVIEQACQRDGVKYFRYDNHVARYRVVTALNKHVPILGCRRHPCDWYVSNYEFRHWVSNQRPGSPLDMCGVDLATMPFSEYVRHAVDGGDWAMLIHTEQFLHDAAEHGCMTASLSHFFAASHDVRMPTTVQQLKDLLDGVTLVPIENVSHGTYHWLRERGLSEAACGAMAEVHPCNRSPSRKRRPWQSYYTDSLRAMVMDREKLLFKMWPEYLA